MHNAANKQRRTLFKIGVKRANQKLLCLHEMLSIFSPLSVVHETIFI